MKKTFKNQSQQSKYFCLHDCVITNITIKNGIMSIYFDDGFWINTKYINDEEERLVHTTDGKVDFYLEDEEYPGEVYLFNKQTYSIATRRLIEWKEFIDDINLKGMRVEIINSYGGDDGSILYKGVFNYIENDNYEKIEIVISQKKQIFCWNEVDMQRVF